jgi:hypothetical protein
VGVLERLLSLFRRPRRERTAEDEAAREEGEHIREGIETMRLGSLEGPGMYTHGGRESRGES